MKKTGYWRILRQLPKRGSSVLILGFALLHSVSLASPAQAPTVPAPCSSQNPCASAFLGAGSLWGIRHAGEVTIAPRFQRTFAASTLPRGEGLHGLIVTEIDGKHGLVGRDGRELFEPQFGRPSVQNGYLMLRRDGQSCLLDRQGVMVVACDSHRIYASSDPNQFTVIKDGKARFFRRDGSEIVHARAAPPQAPAPAPASKPTLRFESSKSPLERLVEARRWDEAIRLAAQSNDPKEARYVLLTMIRTSSTRDARYEAGKRALYEHIGLYTRAAMASNSVERSELSRSETMLRTQIDGPAPSSTFHRIDAGTVGECRARGGTVRTGGCWSN